MRMIHKKCHASYSILAIFHASVILMYTWVVLNASEILIIYKSPLLISVKQMYIHTLITRQLNVHTTPYLHENIVTASHDVFLTKVGA